jgi:acetoin utilization deacetylase AcuC-like enzyme/GNAT superfamily N-acetyltransferase
MPIRFVHIHDPILAPQRLAEVQRIFRSYYGEAYENYAERIPELLRRQGEQGQRTILLTADQDGGHVAAFALAFHYADLNATLLDFLVVDPEVRRRGVGGALYDALRDYLSRMGSRGLYYEARPDDPELESDPMMRKENRSRIAFYERHGGRVITGTGYERKREGHEEGEPYLMFDSLGEPREPSAEEVRGILAAILFRKYGYQRDDPYAMALMASVVDDPVQLQPPRVAATGPARPAPPPELFRRLLVLIPPQHELHHVRERGYVERPVRVARITEALRALPGIEFVDQREFGVDPILAVHDADFVHYLERVCSGLSPDETVYPYVFPIRFSDRKPEDEAVQAGYYCIDTFTPLTYNAYIAARAAVDCALTGAELIRSGESLVYSVCRPPGHHAERRVYGGFCYFNNAAVAAHQLSADGRVAVLDIDFHHGNGTQDIFWERGDVLTLSIHGDPGYAYPYFAGFDDEIGAGEGEGCNVNLPLPEDVEDDGYLSALRSLIIVIERFAPKYLVVSLGLDIAKGDPTGAWLISPTGFERIGIALGALQLPTLIVQEGGYDTRVLGRNARQFIRGIQRVQHPGEAVEPESVVAI